MSLLFYLTSLLVFLAKIDVVFGTITCYDTEYGIGYYDVQLPLYEYMHRWLNLTLACKAVFAAVDAAERHSKGEADTVQSQWWCKYSRSTSSARGVPIVCWPFPNSTQADNELIKAYPLVCVARLVHCHLHATA
ncbi:hypothetical protein Q1695_002319 [Nippostrongylus brasiliensis]|nr:hypothetical protein Q1695_002319 [Nippostrongylus brasiliensis]